MPGSLDGDPNAEVNPVQLLDYRCHAPGGLIGADLPPDIRKVGCGWAAAWAGALVFFRRLGCPAAHDAGDCVALTRVAGLA